MVFIPRIVFHISDFDPSKKKKIVTNANGKSICTILELHMTKTFFEKHTFCNEFTITFLKFENHINYKQACKNQISA